MLSHRYQQGDRILQWRKGEYDFKRYWWKKEIDDDGDEMMGGVVKKHTRKVMRSLFVLGGRSTMVMTPTIG